MALYDDIGRGYAAYRRPEARIAAAIEAALGDAASVANIGAGTGSYEPSGRCVVAVEPSEVMIRQRPPGAARCIQGSAEALPLESASVDAAMSILSSHHWQDLERGLREMARIARRRVVLLTWLSPPDSPPFWLTRDYFPEILAHDRTIFPDHPTLATMLHDTVGPSHFTTLRIPHDCSDGFLGAYWRRPEFYLNADRRAAISSFARINAEPGLEKLRSDLANGRWTDTNSALLDQDAIDVGYRLICCDVRHHR